MRTKPLFLALIALMLLTGSAFGFWVMADSAPHNAPAPRPAAAMLDPEPEPAKQPQPAPATELEVFGPLEKPPTPALEEQPKPEPKPRPKPPELPKDLLKELEALNGKEPTAEDQARIREMMEKLAAQLEAEREAFKFSATITGTVVDASGIGAADATVLVNFYVTYVEVSDGKEQAKIGMRKRVASQAAPLAKTDAAGNFVLKFEKGFPREVKSIEFTLAGMSTDRSTGEQVSFTLFDKETKDGVRLTLPPVGALVGRVVDNYAAPLAGALVRVYQVHDKNTRAPAGGPVGGGAYTTVAADAAGNFRIVGLLAGNYAAQVTHPGYTLAAAARATVTVGTDSSFPGDIVLTIQTSLKVSLVCEKVNPAGHTLSAVLYDASGKRIRSSSTKVGQDGVAIFAGAPQDAVTFEISGSIYEKTGQLACTIKADMHNDHASITLVAREMPMRGGGLRETDRENDRPIGKDGAAPAPATRETSKSVG